MTRGLRTLRWCLLVAAAGAWPMAAWAEETELQPQVPADAAPNIPPEALDMIQKAVGGKKPEKEEKGPFPEFKEVTKDMEAVEGLFTLYRYPASDKTKDQQKLLCKIPKNLLDEDMLFATSISSGGSFTGWMWTDYLIRWKVVGKHLKMVVPETRYVLEGKPVDDVVKRTYNEGFLTAVKIVTMTPQGDPVIDLGELLKSDLANVSFMMGPGTRLREELSEWRKVKNFPENMLIDVGLAYSGREGGSTLGVSYGFRKLPKLGAYKPREADERVGYFLTARQDWAKPSDARDTFERYINRWQLEKRDPSLELSPPKKPIVFIIEKTVPIQWRRWVRQGIEDWNKAFEKIGFTDAIIVQQQTDDNEFAEYDPEDARYNFFRWIVSGRAFAMGPSRTDPRTGQILDADIIMDDSFVRAWMYDFDVYAPGVTTALKGPGFELLHERYPDLVNTFFKQCGHDSWNGSDAALATAEQILAGNGRNMCAYATGMQQQVGFMHNALIATGPAKKIPEHFIGEAIRLVVTHEVGHTLGLRHNFKASSWLTLDDIKKRRDTSDEPTTASVMDYNPLLFFEGDTPETVRHFVSPTVGPYDYWAIEYGYREAGKGENDAKLLKEITARCTQPGLAYATDEDTMGVYSPDPLVNRYDNSTDPAAWAQSRIALCDKLLDNIQEWAVQDGEPMYHLTRAFNELWFEKSRNFAYVGRLIGGQAVNRYRKGDPEAGAPFKLIDPAGQRAALKLLSSTIFADDFYQVDPDVLNALSVARWSHWGAPRATRVDYPIHDRILSSQLFTLFDLLTPPVLQRIYDAELKTGEDDRYTAAEHIRGLRDAIFSELTKAPAAPSDSKPYISSPRRNLQSAYVTLMLTIAQLPPGNGMSPDLHGLVRHGLRELSDQIGQIVDKSGSKLDFATAGHLSETKSRIDRVLEAQFVAR